MCMPSSRRLAIRRVKHRLEITFRRVPVSFGGNGSNTSSAAMFLFYNGERRLQPFHSIALHWVANSSVRKWSDAGKKRVLYRGENQVRGTGRSERGRGNGVGDRKEDGNGRQGQERTRERGREWKGVKGGKISSSGVPPYHDRSRVADVEDGVTPTGNRQPEPRDLTPERLRRALRGIRSDQNRSDQISGARGEQ